MCERGSHGPGPFFRWEAVEQSMPMLLLQSYVNSAEVPGNAKLVQLHPRLEPSPNALPLPHA